MKRSSQIPIAKKVNDLLTDIAKKMGGGVLRVGFLEGSAYPDGTPVAYVAYLNEFGHGGTFPAPARPFFRTMVAKESPHWADEMGALAKLYNYDGAKVLAVMGHQIEGQLQESITNLTEPALSKTTLVLREKFWTNPEDIRARDVVAAQQTAAAGDGDMASGSQAKPLVWTGQLLRSVGSEVVRK